MDEISLQFLQIFDALRQPDNNIIAQAIDAAQKLLALPTSINSLIQILLNPPDLIYKNHAAVFLGKYIDIHLDEIQDSNPIVEQVLQVIAAENDYKIQRLVIDEIEKIIRSNSIPLILNFAQNAFQSGQEILLNAAILLCKAIGTEIDSCFEYFPFFINLISAGLEKLQPPTPIDFAFFLGNFIDVGDPNLPFFLQVWNTSIDFVCQNLNDYNLVKFIVSKLNESLDSEDYPSPFVDPAPILGSFFPRIGDPSIDIEIQYLLLSTLSLAFDIEGVLDTLNVEEFFPLLLQKLFKVSEMAYNPYETSLVISGVDVFEDFCLPFSSSELDSSDLFIDTVLKLIPIYYPLPQTRPGIIIALAYIISQPSDIINEALPQICKILIESVNDEVKIVRDAAAFAISELSVSLEDEIEDYFEMIAMAMLQSLEKEISQDMLLAFGNLLSSVVDTDPIFDPSYNFLIQRMTSAHEIWLHYYFPCLKELCINSKRKIQNVIQQLAPLLFSTIEKGSSDNLIEQAVQCLTSLSESSPELFAPYIPHLVDILIQYLKTDNETLVSTSLLSFGKLMENHSELLSPILTQLTPVLLEIGARDTRETLRQEIINFQQKQQEALEITGQADFDIDGNMFAGDEENEDDEYKISPHAIPSLALSVFSSIAMYFPQIIPNTLQQVINEIDLQMKNRCQDAIMETCKAISLLSRGVSKAQIPPEMKAQVSCQFCNWTVLLINEAFDTDSASNAFQATGQIIELFGAASIGNQNQIDVLNIIKKVLEGSLQCQNKSVEYIKEFHEPFCGLVCEFIASLGPNAPEVLNSLIPIFFNLATSPKQPYRDLAIQILGQLVEHSSEKLDISIKENIYRFVINGIRQNSQHAAFALNQFTNYDGPIIMQTIDQLMKLIYEKLEAQNKRKAISYIAFIDNLVAALGEIERNILKDQFPVQQFAPLCLSAMPARADSATNLDMMYFYVWLANVMNMQPVNEFAAVAIKLFMVPRKDIGGIAEDDSGILQKVAVIMVNCINSMGPSAEEFITTICDNDQFKIQRVQEAINSVQV